MADHIAISPGELDISAGVATALAAELAAPVGAALSATAAASGQLAGWSIAGGLGQVGTGWAAPLGAVRQRLTDTATHLRANASAYARNERAVAGVWSMMRGAAK
ncbi:hypothetical protein ACWEQL_24095 [Kitasatospora sp. NPDC004240]